MKGRSQIKWRRIQMRINSRYDIEHCERTDSTPIIMKRWPLPQRSDTRRTPNGRQHNNTIITQDVLFSHIDR